MKTLIDNACKDGIDVVTLLSDQPDSMRRSSVQVGAYNLGKTYGQQVISKNLKGDETVLVINDASKPDNMQNLVFTGVQDTIIASLEENSGVQVLPYLVDGSDTFVMERGEWIAPFTVYPGEDELLALVQGGLRVLNGEEEAMKY